MTQDNRNYRATSERAHHDLGFAPTRTIDDGVAELAALLAGGRVKNSYVSRFSNYQHLKPFLAEYETPFGGVRLAVRA
ncbi:MAG: NAD-dependent dehydratase, partial [bacterium]|nr:NAD-dependent dehydratase [bacterium]